MISSALGTRSGVAYWARASTQIVRQPTRFAAAQSASPVSTAPTTTSRGGGPNTSAKTFSPSCSSSAATALFRRERRESERILADYLATIEQHEHLAPELAVAFDDGEEHRPLVAVREGEQVRR